MSTNVIILSQALNDIPFIILRHSIYDGYFKQDGILLSMYIAILGRLPNLSIAELESCFGSDAVAWASKGAKTADIGTAVIQTDHFDIERLGGTTKAGKIVDELSTTDWHRVSQAVVARYTNNWNSHEGKITLGISTYNFAVSSREVQKVGIILKQSLKKHGVSLRLIPNTEPRLNTATSHHNKLGLSPNKVELLIVRGDNGHTFIAESTGAQNITALARRDQGRPKRDAFVGMLPPKLAQIMINLASGGIDKRVTPGGDGTKARLLDPFCGTGVILQEAALMGYDVYGTDLSEKMIRYSRDNINWLEKSHRIRTDWYLHEGDAMTASWQQPISFIASETYLGQPFSAPPSPQKLEEVRGNVNHITTAFLKNIHPQLTPGTPLCLAVPAWRDTTGRTTHLPFIHALTKLGYQQAAFTNTESKDLLYYREDQVVARQILVLTRK